MSDIVIRAENLSKQYKIGAAQKSHETWAEVLSRAILAPVRVLSSALDGRHRQAQMHGDDTIWALKGVSFEIKRGEIVGLIGRNGSGKSTLLKILSRITEPTGGFADIKGRMSSLLEVGTGFQPQLTGRENIYLNGVILGMKQAEIEKKFDQIVDFSGVEKFIDTPVKHYSSGMHVRLAFAVAAHLEPDILIVDEVLAVGDARFQKKCLNKMQDVGQQGRTVLFVSHDMQAITRLCKRGILLNEGKVVSDSPSHKVVSLYLNSGHDTSASREWRDLTKAPGDDVVRLCAVRIRTEQGEVTDAIDIRQPVGIQIEYEVLRAGYVMMPYFNCYNQELKLFEAIDVDPVWRGRPRPAGQYVTTGWIPGNLLAEGTVFIEVGALTLDPPITRVNERDVVAFHVIDSLDGDSARGDWGGDMIGVVRPLLKWSTKFRAANETSKSL